MLQFPLTTIYIVKQLVLIAWLLMGTGSAQTYIRDSELLDSLFVNYDNRLAPSYAAPNTNAHNYNPRNSNRLGTLNGAERNGNQQQPSPLNVRAAVHVHALVRVCEQCHTCTFDVSINQQWVDARLSYSPSVLAAGRDGVTLVISGDGNKLWTPRWHFRSSTLNDNSAKEENVFAEQPVKIRPDGTVMRVDRALHTVECNFNYANFPADETLVELELVGNSSSTPIRLASLIRNTTNNEQQQSLNNSSYPFRSLDNNNDGQRESIIIKSMVNEFRVRYAADDDDDDDNNRNSTHHTAAIRRLIDDDDDDNSNPRALAQYRQLASLSNIATRLVGNEPPADAAAATYFVRLKLIRQSEIYCWTVYAPTLALCLVAWLFLLWRRDTRCRSAAPAGNAAQHNYYGRRTDDDEAEAPLRYYHFYDHSLSAARRDRLVLHCLVILLTAACAAYALQSIPATPYLKAIHYWLVGVFAFEFALLLLGATRVLDDNSVALDDQNTVDHDEQYRQLNNNNNNNSTHLARINKSGKSRHIDQKQQGEGEFYVPVSIVPPLNAASTSGNISANPRSDLLVTHHDNSNKRVMSVAQTTSTTTMTTTSLVRVARAGTPVAAEEEAQQQQHTERTAMLSGDNEVTNKHAARFDDDLSESDKRINGKSSSKTNARSRKSENRQQSSHTKKKNGHWTGLAGGIGLAMGLLAAFATFVVTYAVIVHGV